MCDCIEIVNQKLKEANTNTVLDVPFSISKSTGDVQSGRTTVATCKADSKIRKKAQKVFCTFCPFCGDKYAD